MNRDEVFANTAARACDFEFNQEVAAVFDDMLVRSIPFYVEQHHLILEIAERFWEKGRVVYDLGCSTATMLVELSKRLGDEARLVGYDNSEPMLVQARAKVADAGLDDRINIRFADMNRDLSSVPMDNAGVVTMCWTLQFVRPLQRDPLIRKIYQSLAEGGVLIVTEKILTNSSHMNRFFIEFYYEFKRRNRYSEEEILKKREALENVLIPYRTDENFEMFRRNGFEIVETFFQWYNFAGFLCVKKTS
jgi:tRNA (cmo5U34)-methyltransferase